MRIIGLCGGSGSGKSTVAQMFSEYGIPSLNADLLYRELTSYKSECVIELASRFGEGILNPDGSLNRRALSEIVFGEENRENLKALNRISHKHVLLFARQKLDELRAGGAEFVLFDAPLLFESGFDLECDYIIAVVADTETRIARIIARDSISKDLAHLRIKSQLSDEFLRKRADLVIENNSSSDNLRDAVSKAVIQIKTNEWR